jgi:hypothetical protein
MDENGEVKVLVHAGQIVMEIMMGARKWRLLLDERAATHLILELRDKLRSIREQDEAPDLLLD